MNEIRGKTPAMKKYISREHTQRDSSDPLPDQSEVQTISMKNNIHIEEISWHDVGAIDRKYTRSLIHADDDDVAPASIVANPDLDGKSAAMVQEWSSPMF